MSNKRIRPITLLIAFIMVFGLLLAACGPAATEAPVTTEEPAATEEMATEEPAEVAAGSVGVVLPTRNEPRWIQDEARFQEAFDAAGYDVEILFSEGDSAKERANVEDLITKGVQVIIITPHDGSAAAAAAEAARAAGVKVISYDRLILDTDAVDYYVTFDSNAVGAAQGQYLVDKASGTGNPLYLYAGAATDNNAFLFFEGAWNVLQPKIADGTFVIKNSSVAEGLQDKAELTRDEMADIIGQITTDWDFNTAKNLAEANLTATTAADKGDVFILAPNDGTARAIADAFAADADVSSYVVTGQDAEIASVQYIIDGKQSMTVLKDVRTLVADAIAAAVAYLEGGTPPETNTYNNGVIDVPAKPSEVISVDKDNVKEAIIDSGYWPESEFTGLGEAPPSAPEIGTEDNPIKVLFVPSVDVDFMIESGSLIEQGLNEATGLYYEVSVPTSYAATIEEMCASPDDTIGFIPAMGYVLANQLCGVEPGLASERYGWNVYWTQFIVPRDSDIQTLEDLEGKNWGYGDVASTSGYLYPKSLFTDMGITVGAETETGGHPETVRAVYLGEVDFGTTYFSAPLLPEGTWTTDMPPDVPDDVVADCAPNEDGELWCGDYRVLDARAALSEEAPDVVQKVRILALTPEIPNDTLSFAPGVPDEVVQQIIDGVVAFIGTEACDQSLCNEKFYDWTGAGPIFDENFDGIRILMEAQGITMENIGQ
jgi:putative multiple sugar transport system substrate-binding protein